MYESPDAGGAAAGLLGVLIPCCMGLVIYVYLAVCIQKIAQKCGVENTWMAWVPILQIVPLLESGRKPIWWIILCFIPLVNIVIAILVWMAVAENRGKPAWIGILIIVPIVGLFIPAYLAFAD